MVLSNRSGKLADRAAPFGSQNKILITLMHGLAITSPDL